LESLFQLSLKKWISFIIGYHWVDQNVPANMMAKTQIESVMKCLKGSSHHHDFVENWFQSTFGMSYDDVRKAIGLDT
jgi:hypothetical protein